MEGERIVFTHEVEPEYGLRVLASGEVDESVLDALDLYIKLQKSVWAFRRNPIRRRNEALPRSRARE
jgi:hypothetical protein